MIQWILLALVLGLKHALEPDHIVAISTVSAERGHRWGVFQGLWWAAGHTLSVFVASTVLAAVGVTIPASVYHWLERGVGLMIVLLGLYTLRHLGINYHEHVHSHGVKTHRHPHPAHAGHSHKGLWVGVVHGMAGSGAMTAILSSITPSFAVRTLFVIVFGVAMALVMTVVAYGVVVLSDRFTRLTRVLSGTVALVFGMAILLA